MKEYIIIKKFGPIESIELNPIEPFVVLVGESGSGKSTIMKVLSLFRWIYKRLVLRSYVRQAGIKKTNIGFQFRTVLKVSGLDEYLKPNTEIIYGRGRNEISYVKGKLNVGKNISKEDLSLEKVCFVSDKRTMMSDILSSKTKHDFSNYYLQDTLDNFLLATDNITELPINYLNIDFNVQKNVQGIKYLIKGKDKSKFSVNIKNASSGMQTVVPIHLIVEYYAKYFDPKKSMSSSLFQYFNDNDRLTEFSATKNIGDIEQKNVHIMIEEPELNLDPQSQTCLLDFLANRCFIEDHPYDMTLMLATHSPYIVNYLNILLKRGQIQSEKNKGNASITDDQIGVYKVEGGEIYPLIVKANPVVVDARPMSQVIADIYNMYNEL